VAVNGSYALRRDAVSDKRMRRLHGIIKAELVSIRLAA
jgi:hypothetical protein